MASVTSNISIQFKLKLFEIRKKIVISTNHVVFYSNDQSVRICFYFYKSLIKNY